MGRSLPALPQPSQASIGSNKKASNAMQRGDQQEMQAVAYELRVVVAQQDFTQETLHRLGQSLWAVATGRETQDAFAFHVVADAARLMAFSLQDKVAAEYATTTLQAAIRRLDLQVQWEGE